MYIVFISIMQSLVEHSLIIMGLWYIKNVYVY